MANAVWPVSLPQALLIRGLNGKPESAVVRTAMSAGPAKVRARSSVVIETYTAELTLTQTQLVTFWTFFNDTLEQGALAFDWKHPRTAADCTFRFLSPPSETPLAPRRGDHTEKWRVGFQLEVIPADINAEDGGAGDDGEAGRSYFGDGRQNGGFEETSELVVAAFDGYPVVGDDYAVPPDDEDDLPPWTSVSSMFAGVFQQGSGDGSTDAAVIALPDGGNPRGGLDSGTSGGIAAF